MKGGASLSRGGSGAGADLARGFAEAGPRW